MEQVIEDSPAIKKQVEEYTDVSWTELDVGKFTFLITLAHVVENFIHYPFWVLKTRQQTKVGEGSDGLIESFRQLRQIQQREGFRKGLFKGFLFSSISSAPGDGLYYVAYAWSKDLFTHPNMTRITLGETWAPFVAGLIADISCHTLYVPQEVIIQRMQLTEYNYSSAWDATKKIYQLEGTRGFFRGFGASVITWMPASGVWWLSYEYSKRILYPLRPLELFSGKKSKRNYYAELSAAMIATTVSTIMFNPLEIVKTRMQTQNYLARDSKLISNTWTGLVALIRDEGLASLFKGIVPRCISRVPLSATSAFVYEITLHASKRHTPSTDK